MLEIFSYQFMTRAFLAGIAVSIITPLIGSFIVVKRLSLISDTLSHIALAGVAIALLTKTQPIIATVILTTLSAIAIEKLRTSNKIPAEVVLAMFLPAGLAVSLVLLSLANGLNTNIFSFLFGSISTVTRFDLIMIWILAIITLLFVSIFYKSLFFTAFDEDGAKVSGINTKAINTLLMILVSITVSLSMRIVGILLIGALMVIPVITAMQIASSFKQSVVYSICFALFSVLGGLVSSFYLGFPAGATIVLLSLITFGIVSLFFKRK